MSHCPAAWITMFFTPFRCRGPFSPPFALNWRTNAVILPSDHGTLVFAEPFNPFTIDETLCRNCRYCVPKSRLYSSRKLLFIIHRILYRRIVFYLKGARSSKGFTIFISLLKKKIEVFSNFLIVRKKIRIVTVSESD